jgi:formylglycine-generating enzyme required for sulfatase activity
MVLVPGGTFTMGSDSSDESPRHKVRIDTFYLDAREVTNRQYWEFVTATGHQPAPFFRDSVLGRPDHPVVGVNYDDARAYAFWCKKRLPTEAEWEYAARGGAEGLKYPWGNDRSHDQANYWKTGGQDHWLYTAPVGSFPPNAFGLYDMAGNVYEWVADWFSEDYYAHSPLADPTGPTGGRLRVARGGAGFLNAAVLRTSARLRSAPETRNVSVGIRCAMDTTP